MMIDRRSMLKYAGLVPFMGALPRLARAADEVTNTLRIGTGPDHIVSTTLYNGQFPGMHRPGGTDLHRTEEQPRRL